MTNEEIVSKLENKYCVYCAEKLTIENVVISHVENRNYNCRRCNNEISKNSRTKLKIEVLLHYANNSNVPKCKDCGEEHIKVLSLDHINNDGEKHRREIKIKSGHHFYLWIKKNNFPVGFQVLCMNCQFIHKIEQHSLKWDDSKASKRGRKYKHNLKLLALKEYSVNNIIKCSECDIDDVRCLSINYIGGGGRRHRENVTGSSRYNYLKKNNFPSGYRTLCMNHQFLNHIQGDCSKRAVDELSIDQHPIS